MLVRALELILSLLIMIFIFMLSTDAVSSFYKIYKGNLYMVRKFYEERVLMKVFSEGYNFTNNTCNLTTNFFNLLSNSTNFYNYIKRIGIKDNVSIELINRLNNTVLVKIGLKKDNFLEADRVCYYNGSLYLIKIRV